MLLLITHRMMLFIFMNYCNTFFIKNAIVNLHCRKYQEKTNVEYKLYINFKLKLKIKLLIT